MRSNREQEERLSVDGPRSTFSVAVIMRDKLVSVLLWTFIGVIFSFPFTVGAGYFVSFFAESYFEAFVIGYIPAVIGIGIIGTQILLIHEKAHHSIHKSAKWLPRSRRLLPPIAFVTGMYLLLVFSPVEDVYTHWQHPAIRLLDVLFLTLLGVLSPYLAKIIYDYYPLNSNKGNLLWKSSVILLITYFIISVAIVSRLSSTTDSILEIIAQVSLFAIPLFGVFYRLKWNLRERREDDQSTSQAKVSKSTSWVLTTVRDSRKMTFFGAVLLGAWLPIMAGTSAATNAGLSARPVGVEAGVFIFGYPLLLFYIWILFFAPIAIVLILFALAFTATRIANWI